MTSYNDLEGLIGQMKALQDRVERLERAPRAGSTSVDTGTWSVVDPETGITVAYIGLQEHGDVGLRFYRVDGTLAMQISKTFAPTDTQALRFYNRAGEVIGGDQALALTGVAQHYATIPTKTADGGVAVTSATFVDIYDINTISISGEHTLKYSAICSDGTTSGEVRVVNESGNQLTGFFGTVVDPEPIPLGTTIWTDFEIYDEDVNARYFNSRALGADIKYRVQARRTAGAGTVTVKARYYVQRPS